VVQALTRLVTGRTVVMTTHRPALIRLATRTVDLHDGVLQDLGGGTAPEVRGEAEAVRSSGPAGRSSAT
jgi:ABC-type bacteriocin/lantibiotic exporter with double-glycine peptidase domain